MSDLPQQFTINQYVADGVEDIYSYTYQILIDSDIQVYVTLSGDDPNETADLKILSTDYTVQGAGDVAGGTITFEAASIPPSGATVTLRRNVENSINTNFADARNFNGQNLDDAFLRLMLCVQQNSSDIYQVVLRYQFNSFQPDEDATTNILPQLEEGYIWIGSASGGVVAAILEENPDASTLRSELADNNEGTDGAGLVGFYNEITSTPTTVRDELQAIDTVLDEMDADIADKLQSGYAITGDDIGALNAIAVTVSPAYTEYVRGTGISVKMANTTTSTTVTININSLGNKNVVLKSGTNPSVGMMQLNRIHKFEYDGTSMVLLNPVYVALTDFSQTLASAGTMTLPNGFIMKWGSGTYPASGGSISDLTVNFPAAFPNNCFNIQLTVYSAGVVAVCGSIDTFSTSSFHTYGETVDGSAIGNRNFLWLAIGN